MRKIKEYSKTQGMKGKIDVACICVGAASEYPQCFPDIDRQYEKNRIIDSSLKNFSDRLCILENNYYFPAGGTYIIPGKFSSLNDYVAQPSFNQLGTEGNNHLDSEETHSDIGIDGCSDEFEGGLDDEENPICDGLSSSYDPETNPDPYGDNWKDCGNDNLCPDDDEYCCFSGGTMA